MGKIKPTDDIKGVLLRLLSMVQPKISLDRIETRRTFAQLEFSVGNIEDKQNFSVMIRGFVHFSL